MARRLRRSATVLAVALTVIMSLAACESEPTPGSGSGSDSGVTGVDPSTVREQLRAKGCC